MSEEKEGLNESEVVLEQFFRVACNDIFLPVGSPNPQILHLKKDLKAVI